MICTLLLVVAAYAGSHNDTQFGHVAAKAVNSPANIGGIIGFASIAALFVWGMRYIHSVLLDIASPLTPLLFSLPFRNVDYVIGKNAAAFCAFLAPSIAAAIGLFAGVVAPWGEHSGLVPTTIQPYVDCLLLLAIPNALFSCAIVFIFAACARSVFSAYLGFLLLIGVRVVSATATLPALVSELIDPWGLSTFISTFIHDTTFDDSMGNPTENVMFLANRLMWVMMSIFLLVASTRLMRRARPLLRKLSADGDVESPRENHGPRIGNGDPKCVSQAISIACLHFNAMARSWSFFVALVLGIGMLCMHTPANDDLASIKFVSTTQDYLVLLTDNYNLLFVILLMAFTAEVVFYDETHNTALITAAMPVTPRTWIAGKALALLLMTVAFESVGVTTCALLQSYRNPQLLDKAAFAQLLAVSIVFPLIAVASSLIVMLSARSKQMGFAVISSIVAVKYISAATNSPLHAFEFGWLPTLEYSDLIGFGHQFDNWLQYLAYWVAILLAFTLLICGYRSTRIVSIQNIAGVSLLALAGVAYAYWYDGNVMPSGLTVGAAARYERQYSHLADSPQPTVLGIKTVLDLDLDKQTASAKIRYRFMNKTSKLIEAIHLDWHPQVNMAIDGDIELSDTRTGFAIVRLKDKLLPGKLAELTFSVSLPIATFASAPLGIIENGAVVVYSDTILPHIGYNVLKEISSSKGREQNNLPYQRMQHASGAGADNFLSSHLGPSDVDTTIRLSDGLWVIAPGNLLERRSEAGQRQQFHYSTAFPILPYYAVVAGNWERQSEQVGNTNIEVYYHAGHNGNVGGILDAARAALTYGIASFSAYELPTLRVVEMPRQIENLQSFAGLVIVPEQGPFLFDPKSNSHDWTSMLIAHEVSHQWWGYKAIPAQGEGAQVMLESLAQYSAFRVLNKSKPAEKEWFVDDARSRYFYGRRHRTGEDPPLLTANDPYLTYGKGAVIMNNLAELLGESRFNVVLGDLVKRSTTVDASYVTVRDLENGLLSVANEAEAATIRKTFENNDPLSALLDARKSR